MLDRIYKKLLDKVNKYSFYFVIALGILLALSLQRSVVRINKAGDRIQEQEEKVQKLENEKKELEARLNEVKSNEFIEAQLRDKLGLAKEGEIVVVLPDEETVKKFAPHIEEEKEELPPPNWKKWLDLFI
jgi:cell division protein FtsB